MHLEVEYGTVNTLFGRGHGRGYGPGCGTDGIAVPELVGKYKQGENQQQHEHGGYGHTTDATHGGWRSGRQRGERWREEEERVGRDGGGGGFTMRGPAVQSSE